MLTPESRCLITDEARRASIVIRAAVFDFDGVVLESAEIKTSAFRRLFDGNEAAVAHHLAHVGISRYEKFRYITNEILGRPYTEADERRLGERFSALVIEEMLRCPFVPGARELLARLAGELPLFVASGTPEAELRQIVSARGLEELFAGTYGTPPAKDEILRRILRERQLAGQEVVMIGDAMTDLLGAHKAGVRFVGRASPGVPDPFADQPVPVVTDLKELDHRWVELLG
jgi:phosphoglycolate phosphatase-like HAD superfamily hydrolase